MTLIAVETIGFNLVGYCCGKTEMYSAFSELQTCADACTAHHHHLEDHSHCADHDEPGIHSHHHHHGCMQSSYVQLRTIEKKVYENNLIPVFLPILISFYEMAASANRAVDFAIARSQKVPPKPGRDILAKHSILLI